jgi:hypothetical protein
MRQHDLPEHRGRDVAVAVEEPDSKHPFKLLEAAGQAGLGNAQGRCRAAKMAMLCERLDQLQMMNRMHDYALILVNAILVLDEHILC